MAETEETLVGRKEGNGGSENDDNIGLVGDQMQFNDLELEL